MKIDLFNVDEFVEINHLKEVTSGALIQRNNIKHPEGLLSDEIFGVTIKSRKETFAYIDLHGHFFHPHVYKAFKRLFRNIEKIINGELYFSIDKDGNLVKDEENGETGLDFIYNNWEKIKWIPNNDKGMRDERIDLLTKTPKNQVFMKYQIVIPVFYRDITGGSSSGGKTGDINNLYSRLIRYSSMLKDKALYSFQLNGCQYNIQNTIVDIYDYFKTKLEKKHGLIRQYLLGKRVDFCTREVITGPQFHGETPEDNMIDFEHSGVPLSSVCALAKPFMMHWLKEFFTNAFSNENQIPAYNPKTNKVENVYELENPELMYNEKFYEKMLNSYVRDPECRFNKLELPIAGDTKKYIGFSGVRLDTSNKAELSTITYRPMTWTDLLFIGACEVTKDKHILVTRYPVNDEFGIFINKIRVVTTAKTMPAQVNGRLYKYYPVIDLNTPKADIASLFIDSLQFSVSYLKGLVGDFDGDQITAKMVYSHEANQDCENYMKSKPFILSTTGDNIRAVDAEIAQTFYDLTIEPPADAKYLEPSLRDELVHMDPKEFTLNKLIGLFATTEDETRGKGVVVNKAQISSTLRVKLTPPELGVKTPTETTIGRVIYNKILFERTGILDQIGFVNDTISNKNMGKVESMLSTLLKEDKITTTQMGNYLSVRDWLGLTLHGAITVSFTPGIVQTPKEVVKLKNELLKKYKKEIDEKDPATSEMIENTLIDKAKEILKDDPGMELYNSGARGSFNNNYKNMFLFRGAIKKPSDGSFDIVTDALTDGLAKKDISASANTIVNGAYPKAVGTADTGYLAKELLAALQTESLGPKGSDCHTHGTIDIVIPKETKNFEYRYIMENGKPKCLTPEIIKNYVGKKVKLRTPMKCIDDEICNVCAGDFYYILGKEHIGLLAAKVATTCTDLNMKKFHENLIKLYDIDLDDMLI